MDKKQLLHCFSCFLFCLLRSPLFSFSGVVPYIASYFHLKNPEFQYNDSLYFLTLIGIGSRSPNSKTTSATSCGTSARRTSGPRRRFKCAPSWSCLFFWGTSTLRRLGLCTFWCSFLAFWAKSCTCVYFARPVVGNKITLATFEKPAPLVSFVFSCYGFMSILYPIVSFYYINPDNVPSMNLYFPVEIAERFKYFTFYQIFFIFACCSVGLFFFKNPPNQKSALSVYMEGFFSKNDSGHNMLEAVSVGNFLITIS